MPRETSQFPERHAPLRDDIRTLGGMLGEILQEQGGDALLQLVEGDRTCAIRRREAGADSDVEELAVRVRRRPPGLARDLVRAFSSWFMVVNTAENVHRIRRRRDYFRTAADRPQPGGVVDALAELQSQGLTLADIRALLAELSIEPVLVAHPTESARRTSLRRQQRIAGLLLERSNPLLAPYEGARLLERIRSEITTEWQTAEHPRERLTIADEREHAVFYLSEVLYAIVPAFYDEIAAALVDLYGADAATLELPLLVRFGTWVGGDMDGSPEVHAKSIRETLARHQQVIINAYFGECQRLAEQLSQSAGRISVTPELARRIEDYRAMLPGAQGITPSRHDFMPYRVFLGQVAERLHRTYHARPLGYEKPAQFRADIALVAASLLAHRGVHAGLYPVRRLLRRIDTFGFHLATLDLRQHTAVHHAVIAAGLDDAAWTQRGSEQRHARLIEILDRDLGPSGVFDALGRRTLGVFDAIMQGRHRYGPDAIGLYIVAGATRADDVLAPLVLARWASACDKRSGEAAIDVAPQFDSIETLDACAGVMRELLQDNAYRRHLEARGRVQTVVIGYSDSNRDAGPVAARLAAYQAQRNLTAALHKAGEEHVLFYGRGGSVPRGGGRIDALLRAAPSESVSGTLRFTEQGEGMSQNYGLRPNAMRSLERAFSTLARARLAVRRGVAVSEGQALADCAALVAVRSRAAWQALVFEQPGFYDFFCAATPIDVIERMQIAAATAVRSDRRGVEAVRPAAWVYAWSQSRHLLPGWYGAGAGLAAGREQRGIEALRRCYRGWPFFRNLIDDIETMLGRTDLAIAACYDQLAPPQLRHFGATIAAEYRLLTTLVLEIKECAALLDGDVTLQRAIALRNPYIDPMNLMQVDLLRRWRDGDRQDRDLFDALLASVSGIARGLQTYG
ncbi:MAG: phosphoenolpyruvate carboxylase [Gammaproteobacteria bacterium]|nr:phosphoenolpyruvate carboxylase [Gammaproteobacteria bacterium]